VITEWIKQIFHKHEYEDFKPMEPVGVSLGYNLKPVVEYKAFMRCKHCHKEKYKRGLIVFRDIEVNPENYDENGRPLQKFFDMTITPN